MDIATYAAEAKVEAIHWWFVGRKVLFAQIIEAFKLPQDAPVLDIGTSTGTNLRMLRDLGFTEVTGLDWSPEAIRSARRRAWAMCYSATSATYRFKTLVLTLFWRRTSSSTWTMISKQ